MNTPDAQLLISLWSYIARQKLPKEGNSYRDSDLKMKIGETLSFACGKDGNECYKVSIERVNEITRETIK